MKLFAFEGFSVCVSTLRETTNTVARYSGWAEEEDTHTHTYIHTQRCQHFLACLYEKDSSGLLSHFKQSCGH